MNDLAIANPKIDLTRTGLDVREPLSHAEWREIGQRIGQAMQSAAFIIGDWLVYGEGRVTQGTFWSDIPAKDKIPIKVYEEAVEITGMDLRTLITYAYVSKNVPKSLRNEHVSWEHHKKVAKIRDDSEKIRWLKITEENHLANEPLSTRRLARSIEAGRLLSIEEMEPDENNRGIENVHPYVNSICAFWGKLQRGGWLENATPEQRDALRRDLLPVVEIYRRLAFRATASEAENLTRPLPL